MIELMNLLNEHIEHLKALNFSPCTIKSRLYNGRAFLLWLEDMYGATNPQDITTGQLRSWQVHLSEAVTPKGLPLKPRSINKKIESVRAFLTDLHETGEIPAAIPAVLVYVRTPKPLPRALLHRDMRKLLLSINTDDSSGFRNRTMLELAYSSGLRAAELIGMDVADVDFTCATTHALCRTGRL